MNNVTASDAHRTQGSAVPTILRRVAEGDRAAVRECIGAYSDFVWALAVKFTASREKAEAATEEIFTDIWRHCADGGDTSLGDKKLIATIALKRLIKHVSVANRENPNKLAGAMATARRHFPIGVVKDTFKRIT